MKEVHKSSLVVITQSAIATKLSSTQSYPGQSIDTESNPKKAFDLTISHAKFGIDMSNSFP